MATTYTEKQIANAKAAYFNFLRYTSANDYNPSLVGSAVAEERAAFHNSQVAAILNGDKALEKEMKLFFLNEEVKKDVKAAASRLKLKENKAASEDVLAPLKKIKKTTAFYAWLNTKENPFRKQYFSKKYTVEAVSAFIATI